MKIVLFSNFINHHQVHFADALYRTLGRDFSFVEIMRIPNSMIRSGYPDYSSRPYVVKVWEKQENQQEAVRLSLNADVAIFGADSLNYQILRAKTGKLSFEVSERWLKKGVLNLLSPRLLRNMWYYHTLFHKKPIYKLCSSAFAAGDQYKMLSFKNRCYKWGYFTKVDDLDISYLIHSRSDHEVIKIMWCARFLDWKHPEMPVLLAAELKARGYKFVIDMYGSGSEMDRTKELLNRLQVNDCVNLKGNLPNDQILNEMRMHDIFLFTSDKREGWGAVANEAMSNGCVLVASDEIGSVPYLVKDGVNGCVFKSRDMSSLIAKIESLINDRDYMCSLAVNAYNTMKNEWSPACAARNLLSLIDDLQSGKDTSIAEGPCSKALPIK